MIARRGGLCLGGMPVTVGGHVSRLCLDGGLLRCRLSLLPRHQFCRDGRVYVLVQLESDTTTPGPDEDLDGDLAFGLSTIVKINDGVHAFDNLAL